MKRAALTLVTLVVIATPVSASLHPEVILRDAQQRPVLESGDAVSTMNTCGRCHDTAWIAEHNAHAWLGLDEPGPSRSGRSFDTGPGALRRFDPVVYDRVSFDGAFTLGIADWLRHEGGRHVGGGLATTTPDGRALLDLEGGDVPLAFTHVRGADGAPRGWDWKASGVAELNCFLCHLEAPADAARRTELREGRFGWAATATLENAGLVERVGETWRYRRERFTAAGGVTREVLGLRPPTSENCGLCHGAVVTRPDQPFWLAPDASTPHTLRTGEIFGPGRITRSGMNVRDRDTLARAWDVHAERLVGCTDCHPSTNDPAHFAESAQTRPEHLLYDARRIDRREYLLRPSHDFAKGDTAFGTLRDELDGSMRRCESCHDARAAHTWLPYVDRHLEGLQCESCHVPQSFAPALRTLDWTVLDAAGQPRREYRGAHGDPQDPLTLVDGYRPVLLPRTGHDGIERLAPHNLVSSWYWFDAQAQRPVTREQLHAAWYESGAVHPSILAALDATENGFLEPFELGLVEESEVDAVRQRLIATGVGDPQIRAEIQPHGLHHGVAAGAWATRTCSTCHGQDSRMGEPFALAAMAPGGVLPRFVEDAKIVVAGQVSISASGEVVYQPDASQAGLYLFGFTRAPWIDAVGLLVLLLVVSGVILHGGLRVVLWAARRERASEDADEPRILEPETESV